MHDLGDYTVYDAHIHLRSDDPELPVQMLDACGITKAVILNAGSGRESPNTAYATGERMGFEILDTYPDRCAIFTTVDFSTMDAPDFGARAASHFEETVRRGATGLKLYLGKPHRHWMALNDPRIGAVYDKAAELNVPVLIHIGDPPDYWEKEVTPNLFWYEILKLYPEWHFHGKPVPTRETLFVEQRRMLERYAATTFIVPHFGGHAENLAHLGELLDAFPNLYVDTAAYEPVVAQEPEWARAFFIAYQDRVLFGTDNAASGTNLEGIVKRTRAVRRFYESAEEQTDLDEFMPRRPGYTMKGIDLPDSVLRKLYCENAKRLIPGW